MILPMAEATRGILFTAFERSGDEHAAPVIRQIKKLRPDLRIWALGGPEMAQAGAERIEATTGKAAMLLGAAAQALEHKRRVERLARWLDGHPLAVLVPVDSPAANWSICALIRRRQPETRIVHLVAPQLWAWGSWRAAKLRRLTDRVLCLLPFEPAWFAARGVPATYVGHPAFEAAPEAPPELPPESPAGAGRPRLALLPGSRMGEINANWPMMLEVYQQLRDRHAGLTAVVAAVDEPIAARVRELTAGALPAEDWSGALRMTVARTPGVLAWCDLALVVSGTATLHVALRRKPMVVVYNASRLAWNLAGRWIIHTRTFTLPNVLSEAAGAGRVVPEFVPHFRQVAPVREAVERLITDEQAAAAQLAALDRIAASLAHPPYSVTAAAQILEGLASS
jgi:lipid-A-disaccharide synthase